jgi:methylthioribose-1-phosphate isomerase
MYVAAPFSTIDLSILAGNDIPIEERDPVEIKEGLGKRIALEEIHVYNPAFDVTPANLITAIITERGVVRYPYNDSLAALSHEARQPVLSQS